MSRYVLNISSLQPKISLIFQKVTCLKKSHRRCCFRIEVDSKRNITRRVRHLSETSLSSTDLLSPDDTADLVEPMDDLEMSNDVSQTASSEDRKTNGKLGQPEVETEEADDISQKPETPTSSPGM